MKLSRLDAIAILFLVLMSTILIFGISSNVQRRRTKADIAYKEGVHAGKSGIPVLACPYSIDEFYIEHWHRGWIKGKLDE